MHLVPPARTLALASLACLFLAGCGKLVTVKLSPQVVAQDCTSDNDSNDSACFTPCPLATMGSACIGDGNAVVPANSLKKFPAPTDSMVVGWGDSYDAGTQPCACWEWVSTYSRGYVRFDLTKLVGPVQKISYASLSWKTRREEGGSGKACLQKLYLATGPWKRGATPATLLYDGLDETTAASGFVGLGAQAQDWWFWPDKNHGLMFVPARPKTVSKSNAACLDNLEDLQLVVKYRQEAVKWPSGP